MEHGQTKYKLTGLNIKNFLSTLKIKKICLSSIQFLSQNIAIVGVQNKNKKEFLKFASNFEFLVDEFEIPFWQKAARYIKINLIFFVCASLILCAGFVQSFFVFKIQIFGLKEVETTAVINVLNQNGFDVGKLKKSYDLNKIESVLCNQISQISHASAVFVGTTLVVNVSEKISNSDYTFGHQPIVAPCNLIIKNVNLISGTQVKFANQAVLEGEEIVMPFATLANTKLPIPAKATIEAQIQLSFSKQVAKDEFENNSQIILEECQKLMYNTLSSKSISASNLNYGVELREEGDFVFVESSLVGDIIF